MAIAVAAVVVAGMTARADERFWDGGSSNLSTPGNGASEGGSGTWATNVANWDNNGSTHVVLSSNTAVFGGSGAEALVTLGGGITTAGLDFRVGGYTIDTGGRTFTLGTTSTTTGTTGVVTATGVTAVNGAITLGTTQTWTTGTGSTFTVNDNVSSNSGSGAGLTLAGQGTTNLNGTGTSSITGGFAIGSGTANVNSGVVTLASTSNFYVGHDAAGTLNVTTGKVQLSGAASIFLGTKDATAASKGVGTLTVSGSGTFDTAGTSGKFQLGATNGTGTGTINLEAGGTLATNRAFTRGAAGNAAVINFNGGTYSVTTSAAINIPDTITTVVKAGGAIVDVSGSATIASVLAASVQPGETTFGGLTKKGAGTLTLTGANTYAGDTVVSAGTLLLGADGATFGRGTNVTVNANATIGASTPGSVRIANAIAGAGTFLVSGGGVTTLAAANTYTGPTSVRAGTLAFETPAALASTSEIQLGSGTAAVGLQHTGAAGTISRPIALSGDGVQVIDASGSGALLLSGAVTATGTGVRALTLNGTSTAANTISGAIADSPDGAKVSITKSGSGTWVLSGANTYTGGTTLAAGTLEIAGGAKALGDNGALTTPGPIKFTGGTLRHSATNQVDYSSRFVTDSGQLYAIDTNGQYVVYATGLTSSNGTLTKSGAGTLVLTGASTFAGPVTVSGGTLQVGAVGTAAVPGSLLFSAPVTTDVGATLALGRGGAGYSFQNSIVGGGSVAQIGTASVTLTNGANTYGGGTAVSGGMLRVDIARTGSASTPTASATGTGVVTVTRNGVLAGNGGVGPVVVGGNDVASAGGVISAGSGASPGDTPGTLATGDQTWRTGRYVVKFASATATTAGTATSWDLLSMTALNLSALDASHRFGLKLGGTFAMNKNATFQIVNAINGVTRDGSTRLAGGVDLSDLFVLNTAEIGIDSSRFSVKTSSGGAGLMLAYDANPQAAPEPTTGALCLLGGTAVLGRRRRRT